MSALRVGTPIFHPLIAVNDIPADKPRPVCGARPAGQVTAGALEA
jgi:hypothetical protein